MNADQQTSLDWPGLGGVPVNPADWVTTRHPPLDDQLRTLDIPALLIWATHDPISPLAIGERLLELITGSKLVAYDSDDHWVARVRSDEVADEINLFFDTTSG